LEGAGIHGGMYKVGPNHAVIAALKDLNPIQSARERVYCGLSSSRASITFSCR